MALTFNSPWPNIILGIQARIMDMVKDGNGNQVFGLIDENTNQLETPESPSIDKTTMLIDFQNWQAEDLGQNVQKMKGDVVIILAIANYATAHATAPDAAKMGVLNQYEIEWAVHKALQGFSPAASCSKLLRRHINTDRRRRGLKVREIRYALSFEDYSTRTELTWVDAMPDFTMVLNETVTGNTQ